MSNARAAVEDVNQALAGLTARLQRHVEGLAKAQPQARVRLDQPLALHATPAMAEALLGIEKRGALLGGAKPAPPWAEDLAGLKAQIADCQACPLGAKRRHLVFGEGDPAASLAFVGDAPGGDEDLAGKPFVSEAGQLLDRVVAAMGFKRHQVYLCNVLKCRNYAGGEPRAESTDACRPYLEQQLALLKPKAIVSLGAYATRLLLGDGPPLAERRGRWGQWKGVPVMPTLHPADLLRDAGLKRHVWDDMKLVIQRINAAGLA